MAELIFLIVVIISYIAITIVFIKLEKKEIVKLPMEKLKQRVRSDLYTIIILSGLVFMFFLLNSQILSWGVISIANSFLWGFLMIYFKLLDLFAVKRVMKRKEAQENALDTDEV